MKRMPLLLALGVAAASGAYTIIYLYRWEWNRAIIAALFFVSTEIIIATVLLLRRLMGLEKRLENLEGTGRTGDPDLVLERLREHTPEQKHHFAWLQEDASRMNVFLPVLLGAGMLASTAAWLVEQLAHVTTVPALERRLARRMSAIGLPSGGLLTTDPLPAVPRSRSSRSVILSTAVFVGAALMAVAALDFLADRIQTRPDVTTPGVETVIDLELRGELALGDPARILDHLWAACTGPDVFRDRRVPVPLIDHGAVGAVQVVVPQDLGGHGIDRLVGCLNDTKIDKVQAGVVRVTTR